MCAYLDEEKPKKRTRLSKTTQYALKKVTGNVCVVCGESEKKGWQIGVCPHCKTTLERWRLGASHVS